MMPELYIHIGTHKTGTTTIQDALRAIARDHPEEVGAFIGTTPTVKRFMNAEAYDTSLVQQLQKELHRTADDRIATSRFVMSSEALSGSPTRGYQNFDVVHPMLRDATVNYNATVIVYLRRQDSFVESMYAQMIHQGGSLGFEDFLKQYDSPDALDYSRMLDSLSSHFGEDHLVVKSYHDASERGLLEDFGDVIRSDLLKQSQRGDTNPSYSRHALEIARRSNPSLGREHQRQLRRALQGVMAKKRTEPFHFFAGDDRARFLERYRDANVKVADRYFDGNLQRLFPDPDDTPSYAPGDSLTYDQAAVLIVELLRQRDGSDQRGVKAAIRVALAGYPGLRKLLRNMLRRGPSARR